MKILSPVGNFESLKMAVFNGADEVYLGINDFNARNNIDGFSLDTIKQAIDFAHVFGVKVLLAVNILFSDNELQSALDVVVDAYNLGIDAFIVQDLALANLIFENYPQIELHASTQMGIHNLEGVKQIEKFGFKRVVLARETPLEEIKRIKLGSNIEIEYFCQGALCVSFSGNCYLSSYLYNASGNRGKCKQLCRLPYTLEKNGNEVASGYLLSAKDFNMSTKLNALKQAGVDVIKIEGRARRPHYVAVATREYFNALHGKNANQDNLNLAFNRDFTPGYFEGNGNIISKHKSHIGVFVGTVLKVNHGKRFNEVIFTSNRNLSPKSTFKVFYEGKEKSTLTAYDLKELSKGKYSLTTTQKIFAGDKLNLIVDFESENQILNEIKKKLVKIDLYLSQNKQIKAVFEHNGKKIEITGDILQIAQNQPLSKKDIEENFKKSKFFECEVNIKVLDNVFLPKQKLNEFRRNVFDEIYDVLTKLQHDKVQKTKVKIDYFAKKVHDFQIISNKNEKLYEKNIIYSPSTYSLDEIASLNQKCKQQSKTLFLDTPNFATMQDIKLLEDIIQKTNVGIVANNYYALGFNTQIIIGAGLNVYNNLSAKIFDKPTLCAESNVATKIDFSLMTLRHCPFKNHLNANCKNCPYKDGYTYKMENGKSFKLKRKKLSSCTFYLTY